MNKKMYILLGILITCLLFLYQILKKDPLEKFLDQAIDAVSTKNHNEFMNLISSEYVDRHGLTKQNIEEMLRRLFLSFNDIKVITPTIKTSIERNTTGTLDLEFKVVATFVPGQQKQKGVDLSVYGKQRYYLVGGPTTFGTMRFILRREGKFWRLLCVEHIDIGQPIPQYASP